MYPTPIALPYPTAVTLTMLSAQNTELLPLVIGIAALIALMLGWLWWCTRKERHA